MPTAAKRRPLSATPKLHQNPKPHKCIASARHSFSPSTITYDDVAHQYKMLAYDTTHCGRYLSDRSRIHEWKDPSKKKRQTT